MSENNTIPKANSAQVRQIISELNRADLRRAPYPYLIEQIGKLITGVPVTVESVLVGQQFYRGVRYKDKPSQVSYLGHPPADLVVDFQRCNGPGKPMFYCSILPATVLAELDAQPGDKIYLSTWSVEREFFFFRIPPTANDEMTNDPCFASVSTFFETKFLQPVHETFSSQYKITSAIAEKFAGGPIVGDAASLRDRELGAIAYPSVAHVARAHNIAVRPEIVSKCLQLRSVKEIEVVSVDDQTFNVLERDSSSSFNGGEIAWSGRPGQWSLAPGQALTFEVENGTWVAKDSNGNVVDAT